MTPPETRYAKSGDVRIAYQVTGNGPLDLVFMPGFVSNLDLWWENPVWARFFGRFAAFSRLILFDKRGNRTKPFAPDGRDGNARAAAPLQRLL
jgi:hypothetical protein